MRKLLLTMLAVLTLSLCTGCGAEQAKKIQPEETTAAAESADKAGADGLEEAEGKAEATEVKETEAAEAAQKSRVRSPFEEFTATDLDGNPVSEEIFRDYDITMINIWATFCGPCINEMPDLGELNQKWNEKGFQVVGICADLLDYNGALVEEQLETAKTIVEETGASYLHINPEGDLAKRLLPQISVVPTTVFVDKDGKQVTSTVRGSKSLEEWEKMAEELLKKVQ